MADRPSSLSRGKVDEGNELEDATSSSSGSDSDDVGIIESLVAGRARRSTAGNRMSIIRAHEADDDLELLFADAEEEEDVEFEETDDEAASDVELGSSSDDDAGPTAGPEEYSGEQELQQEAKLERQRVRKPFKLLKRPPARGASAKAGPSQLLQATPVSRPKKKSERVSWVPTADDGSLRASSRKQTMENRKLVHERMHESELRRVRQLGVIEAAAKRRKASRSAPMTQAEHLAEAARVEEENAKSLNRWEAAETLRIEEQQQRLAELQDRRLKGPLVRCWSGRATFVDGKLSVVGKQEISKETSTEVSHPSNTSIQPQSRVQVPEQEQLLQQLPEQPFGATASGNGDDGNMDPPPVISAETLESKEVALMQSAPTEIPVSPMVTAQPDQQNTYHANMQPLSAADDPFASSILPCGAEDESPAILVHPSAPLMEFSTKNLVILEGFEEAEQPHPDLGLFSPQVMMKKSKTRSNRPQNETLCVITGLPARYRDPSTGLPYANTYAYAKLKELSTGMAQWSDSLQCYLGPRGVVAKGMV